MQEAYEAPKVVEIGSLHEVTLQVPIKAFGGPDDAHYPRGQHFHTTGFASV